MYDPVAVQPMRDEVTRLGVTELRTAEAVENAFKSEGTTLVFINSVCGCAAGGARPALSVALKHAVLPDHLTTAFAGNDVEAVKTARAHFSGYAPSSPQFALMKDGEVIWMLERWQIEGRHPLEIAATLTNAFDTYCAKTVAA
jgi:putative YphP/YqiW family bacilliredoxin